MPAKNNKDDIIDVKIHIDEARAISVAISRLIGLRILDPGLFGDLDMDLVMQGMAKITYADKSNRLFNQMRNEAIQAAKWLRAASTRGETQ